MGLVPGAPIGIPLGVGGLRQGVVRAAALLCRRRDLRVKCILVQFSCPYFSAAIFLPFNMIAKDISELYLTHPSDFLPRWHTAVGAAR